MKLLPLLDRTGNVKYWADPRSSWMVDLDGNAVALIAVDAVYDRNGVQVGWWYGDHLRNRNGQVVLFVSRSKIEGLMMPAEKTISRMPTLRLPSGKPNFDRLGIKPAKKHEWADVTSLPFQDRRRRTLAQIKRVLALAAERHLKPTAPQTARGNKRPFGAKGLTKLLQLMKIQTAALLATQPCAQIPSNQIIV
jgi:hypothetical protein